IQPTRREILGGLAAAALAARLPSAGAGDKPAEARRFDFHHHFAEPSLLPKEIQKGAGRFRSIEAMDKGGVTTAFLSGFTGPEAPPDAKEEAARARKTNAYGAKLATDHKGRLGLFAVLPLPHIDESLKEIEYALDTLKTDGVCLFTNYGNRWLGDKA